MRTSAFRSRRCVARADRDLPRSRVPGTGGHAGFTSHLVGLALAATAVGVPSRATAQAGYYDLDAGRPTRVEDGVALERYGLAVQVMPTNVERMDDGTMRVRVEPKLAFAPLPMTEFELRAPFVYTRASGGASTSGLTGIGFGALRALTIERRQLPALALFGEVVVPASGSPGAPFAYSIKGILTKTTTLGRLHVNLAGGTYGLPAPRQISNCPSAGGAGECVIVPQFPDPPCAVAPLPGGVAQVTANASARRSLVRTKVASCGRPTTAAESAIVDSARSGPRAFVGVGFDRALPLRSLLLSATTYVERFTGPYVSTDWAVELGVRHQLSPQAVIDAGIVRRLSGRTRSTALVLGLTYGITVRLTGAEANGATP